MPMTDASKAALAAFFATRRGGKQLQEDIQRGLLAYFVAKGRTLRELTIDPPEDADDLKSLVEEWKLYAETAGMDEPDCFLVGKWIAKPAGAAQRARSRSSRLCWPWW